VVDKAAAETATGFKKKENTLGGPRSHGQALKQTGYGRNSDGPNAHTPHHATFVWAAFRNAGFKAPNAFAPDRNFGKRFATTRG